MRSYWKGTGRSTRDAFFFLIERFGSRVRRNGMSRLVDQRRIYFEVSLLAEETRRLAELDWLMLGWLVHAEVAGDNDTR